MNSTNETLLFDRFLIMYDLCVFTYIIFIFVFRCTHVRMSYVLNYYLLTYLLTSYLYLTDLLGVMTCGSSWHARPTRRTEAQCPSPSLTFRRARSTTPWSPWSCSSYLWPSWRWPTPSSSVACGLITLPARVQEAHDGLSPVIAQHSTLPMRLPRSTSRR